MGKNIQSLLVILVCWFIAYLSDAPAQPPAGKSWRLIWSDEFDGTRLDSTKWSHYRPGTQRRDGWWLAEDSFLDGMGHLIIRTKQWGDKFSSGAIHSDGKFEIQYGYFECRARLSKQPGHWPAFWLQSPTIGKYIGDPARSGVEIDIMEYAFVHEIPYHIQHALHWDGYGADHKTKKYDVYQMGLENGFHTFGLEWNSAEYIFYVDGKPTWRTNTAVSRRSEFIRLTEEIGTWAGDITKAQLPDSFIVDYVRVYQDTTLVGIKDESKTQELPNNYNFRCYPNPFRVQTMLHYSISKPVKVNLVVYDVLGRIVDELMDEDLAPGDYTSTFNARSHPSGIYFTRLVADGDVLINKMLLVR